MDPEKLRRLEALGLTDDDWRRIKALAESVVGASTPAALNDLSQPVRIGACMPEDEGYRNGRRIGSWKGRVLLLWDMTEREKQAWRVRRRA